MAERDYSIVKEGQEEVMKINAERWAFAPSLEDNALCMATTIDKLVESPGVSRIIFSQRKQYNYDYEQTQMLIEIANLYKTLIRQKRLITLMDLPVNMESSNYIGVWRGQLQNIVLNLLRNDPIGAYVELKRLLREENIRNAKASEAVRETRSAFIDGLNQIENMLENTKLINLVKDQTAGYSIGDRSIYKRIFRPSIMPDFVFTKLMLQQPITAEELDVYSVNNSDVTIFKTENDIKCLYHLTPPEFKISEDKYMLLDLARTVLAEHKPSEEEFLEPEKMRGMFYNIGKDLLQELADNRNIELTQEELDELAKILVRYTVGFGLIEILLQDPKVQDITINSPVGDTPIFLVHETYEECSTNIMPSREDVDSWATKFRILSGRPLDEANPILDTELAIPGARARVSIIQKPLNPYGIAFSFRRHRDKPWTLPLFIKQKMISPLGAGLLSFLIDGSRSLIFAGTRSSGKTSILGASLLETMRKFRIITIEDSVSSDAEILIKRNNKWERIAIGYLIDSLIETHGVWYNLTGHEILGNNENIDILAMDKNGKIKTKTVSKFIRHKVKKNLYRIKTKSGRDIKVTGDHSLFGLDTDGKITNVLARDLKDGDFIATPKQLTIINDKLNEINLINYIDKFENAYVYGGNIKDFLKKNYHEVQQLGKEYGHNRSLISKWFREGIIHVKILGDLKSLGYNINEIEGAFIKVSGNSKGVCLKIKITDELLTLVGLWLADGCYDKTSIIVSSVSEEERDVIKSVAQNFDLPVKMHSDKVSLMINSVTLKTVFREVLGLKGDDYTKRVPNWAFSLPNDQLKCLLCGLFSGDGHVSQKEIMIALASKKMLDDIQTLLLRFGINHRIGKFRRDKTYNSSISSFESVTNFSKIGFLQSYKKESLERLYINYDKRKSHRNGVIPLKLETKKALKALTRDFDFRNYIYHQNSNLSIDKLNQALQKQTMESPLLKNIKLLLDSDILWDEIKNIEIIKDFNGYVYDLSVPECESFVVNNIIAHNTLELNSEVMRKLGYNIQPMKVRSALTKGGTEIPADEGIRTSLRMGDSSLIVGEIRSTESVALYEAMRIGAMANLVAGTIHGDSPYGVYDRVVNDLQVPKTSFKATDIIVISNPMKSPDGMHKWRRIVQITEVRKHWIDDPLVEKGFVDLMKYNSKTDMLEPTDDLINGDSEIIKAIAGNVKEWAGNWDAVWGNILLRAKIKETIVNYSEKENMPGLLEAEFVVIANDQFHKISDYVKEDAGNLDLNRIFFEWEEWLKRAIKELKMR